MPAAAGLYIFRNVLYAGMSYPAGVIGDRFSKIKLLAMGYALAADFLPPHQRGTGYGALATINSFGDLLSSIIVGFLWNRVSYSAGFIYGACLTLAGAIALFSVPLLQCRTR